MLKKLFIVAQILLILAIASGIIYSLLKPVEKPDYNKDDWKSWQGFYVISYQGIVKKTNSDMITRAQLTEHLSALKKAGFHTITPADAVAYLEGNSPLPEKALLLLFEGGRKDTLFNATPLLQNNRFFGVMCIPTKATEAWGTFYLNTGEIQKIAKSPNWRIGSMGHRATESIPVDASGTKGHFLTDRVWSEKGLENNMAFAERVDKDYEHAAKILGVKSGTSVDVYLYPFSDPGSKDNSRIINRNAVKKYHRIAFARTDNAFNTQKSDPYNLGRIRVPVDWNGQRLLQELQRYAPRESISPDSKNHAGWSFTGMDVPSGESLELIPGASAWARGTDNWTDCEIEAKVSFTENSTAFIYGRYKDPGSYIRLSIRENGIRLQESIGKTMQTLAWYESKLNAKKEHLLKLRIKGNRAWANLEGNDIIGPVPLTKETDRGKIGIGSQDGPVLFNKVRAWKKPTYFVMANTFTALPHDLQNKIGAILPPWFSQSTGSHISREQVKELLLAASSGAMTIPIVDVPAFSEGTDAKIIADTIDTFLGNPLIHPLISHVATHNSDSDFLAAIRSKGYKIVRILTPVEVAALSRDIKKIDNTDSILVTGNKKDTMEAVLELLRSIPGDRLIAPVNEMTAGNLGINMLVSPSKQQ